MSAVGLIMNLLLAGLLVAALGMGMRLNRRLKALRDSQDGFANAVRELNDAAARAEQGLADLRAATDEAVDDLADRIAKGRALAARLEGLIERPHHEPPAQPAPRAPAEPDDIRTVERRLGALLAAAREGRPDRAALRDALAPRAVPAARPAAPPAAIAEDDLFEDIPLILDRVQGGRR